MKKVAKILTVAMFAGFASCSFLDKEPLELQTGNYYNTDAEFESALLGAYSPLMQEHFYGNCYPLDMAGGDDLSFFQRSSGYTSIMCANANSTTSTIHNYWRVLYDGINRANLILDNLETATAATSDTKKRIHAEALFLRSFYYFHLVQGWGDVPFRLTGVADLDQAVPLPRTSKNDIYDKIIADIESIVYDLPSINTLTHTETITQTAAMGILARIYLFRAGEHNRDGVAPQTDPLVYYGMVKYWAEQVVLSGLHDLSPSYKQVFIDLMADSYNSTGFRESMWEAAMAGTRAGTSQAAGRIGNVNGFGSNDFSSVSELLNTTGLANPGYSYKFLYASLKLYEMYEEENDTERGEWNITPFEYTYATTGNKQVTGRKYYAGKTVPAAPAGFTFTQETTSTNKTRCASKFSREYEKAVPRNKNYTPTNFPILRYSDVLLMLAEAINEIDGPGEAYQYINKVRHRAGLTVDLSGLDQESFLEAIKKERAMELCFEGLRRWDLIRWGDFYSTMRSMPADYVNKTGWNSAHAYAANYYKVTAAYVYYPIPDSEISGSNSLVTQNQGW